MVDGGVLPLRTKNSGAFIDWHSPVHNSQDILFRGIVFIYHRGKGGGARRNLGGEWGGGIGRSQQSVKGGIWKLYCQLTVKRGGGGGGGGGGVCVFGGGGGIGIF